VLRKQWVPLIECGVRLEHAEAALRRVHVGVDMILNLLKSANGGGL
jgi:hypothetical protein